MTLRTRVAAAAGLGVMATIVLGDAVGAVLHVSSSYSWRASGVFVAAMLVVLSAAPALHPYTRFGAANAVTTVRLVLVSLIAGLVAEPAGDEAAWLVVGATILTAALDWVDGMLARRSGLWSALGARFDMETDALLILLLSVLVWQFGKAGPWVLGCGLMRYGFVAAQWALPWMRGPLSPTFRGKAVAVVQFIGLGVAMAPVVAVPVSNAVAAGTLVVLAWSFAVDVRRLRRGGE